jgi:hypothetical protein
MSRLHQYLNNKTLSFECKWWIEDMQRLRGEYKRDGKKKCLDERPGKLLKIYMGKFYGMIGRLNNVGGFLHFLGNMGGGGGGGWGKMADVCVFFF